jgi:hypothetical protein
VYEPPQPPSKRFEGKEEADRRPQPKEELRDACVSLARRARDAFSEACSSDDPDEADSSFASAKSLLDQLWDYAYLRDRPFRDLLALLEGALKPVELESLRDAQREAIRQAFDDLPRWMLDDSTVEGHIDRFAEEDIDPTAPVRGTPGKKVRVTIEVIEE